MTFCFVKLKCKRKVVRINSSVLLVFALIEGLLMICPLRISRAADYPLKNIQGLAIFTMVTKGLFIVLPIVCIR